MSWGLGQTDALSPARTSDMGKSQAPTRYIPITPRSLPCNQAYSFTILVAIKGIANNQA